MMALLLVTWAYIRQSLVYLNAIGGKSFVKKLENLCYRVITVSSISVSLVSLLDSFNLFPHLIVRFILSGWIILVPSKLRVAERSIF
jgi:hypothetical protein